MTRAVAVATKDPARLRHDRAPTRAQSAPTAGPAGHAGLVVRLQHLVGNQVVQQLMADGTLVQRYPVPGRLACDEVVPWLNANSPYAPEWAETRSTYEFVGSPRVSTSTAGGVVTVRARGHTRLSVRVRQPIDRPTWNPTPPRRPGRAADVAGFAAMRATLDAHEREHRRIGEANRVIAENNFRALDVSATGSTRAEAMRNLADAIRAEQEQWRSDAQAAQDAIDPFRGANLACP
jgi:hypothetical protein